MTGKVGQQDINHVVINRDMVHITIVIISTRSLQIPRELNIMMQEMPGKKVRAFA